jgi:uncharacterized protein YjbI with pentapeptide repeats
VQSTSRTGRRRGVVACRGSRCAGPTWGEGAPRHLRRLHGADLTTTDLITADLTATDLITADLTATDLITADLTATDLITADLTVANLTKSA